MRGPTCICWANLIPFSRIADAAPPCRHADGFYEGSEDYFKHTTSQFDLHREPTPRCGEGCSQLPWDDIGTYSAFLFSNEALAIIKANRASAAKVSQTPSGPRSWANFRLLYPYSHRNAWAGLHLLQGQPNTFLASGSAVHLPRVPVRPRAGPSPAGLHRHVQRLAAGARVREQQIGGSGGSLEPPGPLPTHLHNVYMEYSECLPTRLNPLAERTCFSQACGRCSGQDRGDGRATSRASARLARQADGARIAGCATTAAT